MLNKFAFYPLAFFRSPHSDTTDCRMHGWISQSYWHKDQYFIFSVVHTDILWGTGLLTILVKSITIRYDTIR